MENGLQHHLGTLFVGKVWKHFATLGSTNEEVARWARQEHPPEGSVVTCDHQTAGKGYWGNRWEGEPGQNLAMSLLLYPQFLPPTQQFQLNMAVSLAVHDLISHYLGAATTIKWPNDVFFKDKKIAGILIENSVQQGRLEMAVVGIGINVNQTTFPAHLPHAASLRTVLGQPVNLASLMVELCQYLEARYLQLRQQHADALAMAYRERLFRMGEWHDFKVGEQVVQGRIDGVSEAGELLLFDGLHQKAFQLKEIAFQL